MTRTALMLYDTLLGIALLFTPWSRYWQENWFFWHTGSLQSFLMSGPVRGAISGLGAAFLIHAAGRLAGIAVIDEDDDFPQSPPREHATADAAPAPAPIPSSGTNREDGDTADPKALLDPAVPAAATAAGVRER